MQIEEVGATKAEEIAKQEEAAGAESNGFEFAPISLQEPRVFPNFKTKETTEKFFKWGITDKNQELGKYRFNKSFHLVGAEEFLKDLLNDRNVISSFGPLRALGAGEATEIKYTHLNCNILNMSFFDIFQELNLVSKDGTIRQNYEERFEGILLGDRVRQALLWEDGEDYESYEALQADKYQKEFIFRLFQHIAIGGSICQYEDNI